MTEQLLEAIKEGKPWLDNFTRYNYREAFRKYCDKYEMLYRATLHNSSSPNDLAQKIVQGIEDGWKKERIWNRGAARVNDKMMVIAYLTPMLLASGEEACHALAEAICQCWCRRWPENTYQTASFDTLLRGFRHSVLGIDFEGKHMDK